jgi:rod shape-determining protein MreD
LRAGQESKALRQAAFPAMLAAACCLAFVLQTSLRAFSVVSPDLLLLLVVVVAIVRGPTVGAVTGFACGLLVDLAPGSVHAVGIGALAHALAGYVAGIVNEADKNERRRLWFPLVLVSATIVAFGAFGGLVAVLDERRFVLPTVTVSATAAASTLLLGLLAVPLLAGAFRRWS